MGYTWPSNHLAFPHPSPPPLLLPHPRQGAPNELHITLLSARHLPIMDRAVLYGRGSSDPFVTFELANRVKNQKLLKSSVQKRTTSPQWNETFVLPITPPGTPSLLVNVLDYDVLGTNDLIGTATIDLGPLSEKLEPRHYQLLSKEGEARRGEVELALKLRL